MTQKLYHDDAYQQEFQAQVLERITVGNGLGLILDKTCFYPTSGGQPHDQGTLNGIPVSDVFEREDDGAVVHVVSDEVEGPALSPACPEPSRRVEGPVPDKGETVHGRIDWEHRFDHMQQHTGQHILSQAFLRLLDAATVGFHLGAGVLTIDVDKAPLEAVQLDKVEELANTIDLPYDMSALLKEACQIIGGSGGGRPDMAQGGGPAQDRLEQALEFALRALEETYH